MKKILLLSVVAVLAYAGCKKKENTVSTLVTVSYPTITIQTPKYYSFPVGGGPLPTSTPNAVNSIIATAYDSFYHQKITPVIDVSHLSNLAPGLYVATLSAKNSYGFIGYAYVYVAITSVPDTMDISGTYWGVVAPADTSKRNATIVSKVATGLYTTSNVAGVDTGTAKTSVIPAVFAVTSSTTIDFGSQPTSAGTLTASNQSLTFGTGDTLISYSLNLPGFGSQQLTFAKQ